MSDCLFCDIVAGKIPAKVVYEDADVVAFEDIEPQAPVHVLVVPRTHIATLNDVAPADEALMGKVLRAGAAVARKRGVDGKGWRAVLNTNADAAQLVFHVHLHVLAGRRMGWPPG